MKQHKAPLPNKIVAQSATKKKSTYSETTKEEVLQCVKSIVTKISKDPRKAAQILEAWTKLPSQSSKKDAA